MLAECIQQQLRKQNSDCSIHQLRGQIANHSHAIEMKLENHDFGQWQNIKHALKNFDYGFCEDSKLVSHLSIPLAVSLAIL